MVLQEAIQRIWDQLQQVDNDITAAKKHVSGVLEYFGEDPEKNASAFFNTLTSFCSVRLFFSCTSLSTLLNSLSGI